MDYRILIQNFKRALELKIRNGGNGKSPFDVDQLESELERRLDLASIPKRLTPGEEYDLHDEFS